ARGGRPPPPGAAPASSAPRPNPRPNPIVSPWDHRPATPSREAMLSVRRRVEAAKRGEAPAPAVAEQGTESSTVAALGHTAPDFVVPDFTAKESARLRRFLGKPILMVFYHPASPTTPDLLRYAQKV